MRRLTILGLFVGLSRFMFEKIYEIIKRIPRGRVATYGQIAELVEGCTPRMVGYALAASEGDGIPWQRVINSKGEVSHRAWGKGHIAQRQLLEGENVVFNEKDRVDLKRYLWRIPGDLR